MRKAASVFVVACLFFGLQTTLLARQLTCSESIAGKYLVTSLSLWFETTCRWFEKNSYDALFAK